MAKYNITYACGHEAVVDLVGKITDRERKIEWLETTLCPECYKKQQLEENQTVVMKYSEYMKHFSDYKKVNGTYNGEEKTIAVLISKAEYQLTDEERQVVKKARLMIKELEETIQLFKRKSIAVCNETEKQKQYDKNIEYANAMIKHINSELLQDIINTSNLTQETLVKKFKEIKEELKEV